MDANVRTDSRAHSPNWIGDLPILGPEDIAIDREAGVAYVSSQDRRAAEWLLPALVRQRATAWTERGRIYKVSLRDGLSAEEMPVATPSGVDFHPAGIDLFVSPDGKRRLFVVNWQSSTAFSIEVFDLADRAWCHQRSATASSLTLPNDVAALDEKALYVTNSSTLPPLMQGFEKAFCLPTGNVLFHDLGTGAWQRVAEGIAYANGLALDRKRNRLFVASTLSHQLLAFPWDPRRPGDMLSSPRRLRLEFMPDNLGWEDEDTLWVAGSEFFKSVPYTLLWSETAPSHVARIRLADPSAEDPFAGVEPVYDNDGSEIAQCSVGAPCGSRFLVGSCFDDHASAFGQAAQAR